ncbi:MAG: metallophosphoesterase [Deltaproteobacteria bacterium]|uniref:Phosphoesterase n=1 Tax=Candidatus Zymogenus saltonus TaxID=2844893 RepID=A0A9D8KDB0_9DELT|nr:metallophosphoesterase [Candidatus Zymogenus saltonus]
MRIGVISDTHISSVGDDFKDFVKIHFSDVDVIIHAGDFIDVSVAEYLYNYAELNFYGVSGNMDRGVIQDELPKKRVENFDGVRIGIIHGWGSPSDLPSRVAAEFSVDSVDCVVFGHSHTAMNRREGGVLLFNPGAPFDRRFSRDNTIGYLTVDSGIEGEIVSI